MRKEIEEGDNERESDWLFRQGDHKGLHVQVFGKGSA
jgi:hypothetical protein